MSGEEFVKFVDELDGHVFSIGVDTEFGRTNTLTIQTALQVNDRLRVQVYHAASISIPSLRAVEKDLRNRAADVAGHLDLLSPKEITPGLSPAHFLINLLEVSDRSLRFIPRTMIASTLSGWGMGNVDLANRPKKQWGNRLREFVRPALTIKVVGHFLRADLLRMLGRSFAEITLTPEHLRRSQRKLKITENQYCALSEDSGTSHQHRLPIIGYICIKRKLYPVQVDYFDTCFAAGGGVSLDELARTYLGQGKIEALNENQKLNMEDTFRRNPRIAWTYAVQDVILTLKVWDAMRAQDREICRSLGIPSDEVPELGSTIGRRTANLMAACLRQQFPLDGNAKVKDGRFARKPGGTLKNLARLGGPRYLNGGRKSRFGKSTWKIHGGLCFTRSPDIFFHQEKGAFRDIDCSQCYSSIAENISIYVGEPMLEEPGKNTMNLKEAIKWVGERAAGSDAFFIKVTGRISGSIPNCLIPSTCDATHTGNYRDREESARKQGRAIEMILESEDGASGLFSKEITSGTVCQATWDLIQVLPKGLREDYEALRVDSIVFYHKKFVAKNVDEYREKMSRFKDVDVPFSDGLDLEENWMNRRDRIDHRHVCLEVNFETLIQRLRKERSSLQGQEVQNLGLAQLMKLLSNTIYGVLASENMDMSNIVAANVITATGRAMAFMLQMSLNGFQVITDGTCYRTDQVPAETLRQCLMKDAGYFLRRPDGKIRFQKSKTIPVEPKPLTVWLRKRISEFLEDSQNSLKRWLDIFEFSHKKCDEGRVDFDGLICHGSSNYMKLRMDQDGWVIKKFKARGFSDEAKQILGPWLLATASTDNFHQPAPICREEALLNLTEAKAIVSKLLDSEESLDRGVDRGLELRFPLGFLNAKFKKYNLFNDSSFIFTDNDKRQVYIRAQKKLRLRYGVGLELVAMLRTHPNRKKGSIKDLARIVFEWANSDSMNLSRKLNLTRENDYWNEIAERLKESIAGLTRENFQRLLKSLSANPEEVDDLTGLWVNHKTIKLVA